MASISISTRDVPRAGRMNSAAGRPRWLCPRGEPPGGGTNAMKLSLIVRGQHPPGDTVRHLSDDLELVRCADRLGFDGIVKGSHYSAHPFEAMQQVPFLAYCAAIAPRLRLICG